MSILRVGVDIDGVLANSEWREKNFPNWDDFYSNDGGVSSIPANHSICWLVRTLGEISRVEILLVTGRAESTREATAEWLHKVLSPSVHVRGLFMRKDDDKRPIHIIKIELYKSLGVDIVIDDSESVCKGVAKLGIASMRVRESKL